MIKVNAYNGSIIAESILVLSADLVNKLKNPKNQRKITYAMKDLMVDHTCRIKHDNELSVVTQSFNSTTIDEDQLNELKKRHEDFLDFVGSLPLQEDMVAEPIEEAHADKPVDDDDEVVKDISFYNEAIDALRKEAADRNITITATVESLKEDKTAYLGYLPFPVYIAKLIALNALNDE